jgi:hypothetical protein
MRLLEAAVDKLMTRGGALSTTLLASRAVCYAALFLVCLAATVGSTYNPFIYFNF